MTPFSIRDATADDAEAFVEIMWAVGAEAVWIGTEVPFDREQRAERFRTFVADDANLNLVASAGGQSVGHLGMHPTGYGTLEAGMAIVDGHRGQGIGTALMAHALDWARTTPAHKVELQVWPDNARALALYEKFGFEREGYLRRHYRRRDGSLRDAIIMGLLLDGSG